MFRIEKRRLINGVWSKWTCIWESDDGSDTAYYLKNCVTYIDKGTSEYRMLFV